MQMTRETPVADGARVDPRQLVPGTQFLTHTNVRRPCPGVLFRALHEFFEIQADRRPDSVAVEFGRAETTYAELEQRANRIARCLRARGVRCGGRVALLLPRSPDTYAAMLGILKAGAAYVPLDPDCPPERIAFILRNSEASVLVTTTPLAQRLAAFRGMVLRMDADRAVIAAESPARLARGTAGVGPGDLCYIIYTSGSTGRSKGVMIEHRSACHLVREEGRLYAVRASDRIYQGAPLAFDHSVEEIWLAFQSGATLVAATSQMAHAGPDLARHLTAHSVTVLSCVPTQLSLFSEDVPSLRLLIVGGEACPQELVNHWARPGRTMLNTYGPTETTVIATCAALCPGRPVTLGRPLPGYQVHVLDDLLRPVPRGTAGEICIGGVGVARGYVGQPGAVDSPFVPDPFVPADETDARLFRTGDLGRWDAEGNLEFLGRADSQVKLRGFQVELAEIESALMQDEHVRAAACAVREDVSEVEQLVGYVVLRDGEVDEELLRARLRSQLPAYMVPALIETVDGLPRLPGGKLDRKSLPPPRSRTLSPHGRADQPRTETERHLANIWRRLFPGLCVGVRDDFFLDLGGHSLPAARLVSELRQDPRFGRVSVLDVYEYPTIASLAAALEKSACAKPVCEPKASPNDPRKRGRHCLAGILQSIGLYAVFGFNAVQWVTPYLLYFLLRADRWSFWASTVCAAGSALLVFPLMLGTVIAIKWLVLGRIRPGRHPLWGGYYLRWWLVQTLISGLPLDYLASTPLLPWIYRLLGARMGKDVQLATTHLAAFDVISVGAGSSVDDDATIYGYTVEKGEIVIAPVQIGRGCFVGTGSVLREGTVMEDGVRLEDLSLLPRGVRIPAGEIWAGSPATRAVGPVAAPPPPPTHGPWRRAATALLYAALALLLPIVLLAALLPGIALLVWLDPLRHPLWYLGAVPVAGGSFVLGTTAEVVLLKWLLVGRVKLGTYPVHGWFYVRNWMVDQLLMMSLKHGSMRCRC